MLTEFKKFLLRGNLVELAVAVVVGLAFGAVVASFVEDIITPLIAAIGGQPDFAGLTFTLNGSVFRYGEFINALISFAIIAAVVFFLVMVPVNALVERSRREPTPDPTTRKCPECFSEIPVNATRCAYCTTSVTPATTS